MKHNFSAPRAYTFGSYLLVALLLSSLLASTVFLATARAQETAPEAAAQLTCNDVRAIEGLSVALPDQEGVTTKPGAEFSVPVSIGNSFDYELRDLSIGAVLFFDGNAVPFDWFTLEPTVSIAADSTKTVPLTWSVPHNAPEGKYELAVYVHQGNSQHLLTSALSRHALSASLNFTVSGEVQAGAQFDISSILVNGKPMTAGAINTFPSDVEQLEFSIDIVNEYSSNPQVGPVTFTIYESFYPHSLSELESETFEARLLSESRQAYTLDFSPNFNQYIVTGQFKAADGSQSSFLVLLQRDGAVDTLTQPLPTVGFVGVAPKGEGESEVIACIENNESALLSEDELAPIYPVSYRLSVHPIDGSGEPVRSDLITNAAGEGELGGELQNFGFTKTFAKAEQFMVRVEVLKEGEVVDVREVRYQCDADFGCAISPEYLNQMGQKTIFGIGATAFILGMQLATLAILLIVMSIFFCNVYPLMMRSRKSRQDDKGMSK